MWKNSTKQSVVHHRTKFLRESKESGKANLPFRSQNLTFIRWVQASTRGMCFLTSSFSYAKRSLIWYNQFHRSFFRRGPETSTGKLIGSLLTHWLHWYRIAHKRTFSEWEDYLSTHIHILPLPSLPAPENSFFFRLVGRSRIGWIGSSLCWKSEGDHSLTSTMAITSLLGPARRCGSLHLRVSISDRGLAISSWMEQGSEAKDYSTYAWIEGLASGKNEYLWISEATPFHNA